MAEAGLSSGKIIEFNQIRFIRVILTFHLKMLSYILEFIELYSPSPSRGGLGWGWVGEAIFIPRCDGKPS
jgi:hypothetical protein